jgi:hypothetical protein
MLLAHADAARAWQVVGAFYSYVTPTAAAGDPTLIAASADTAALLDLDPAEFGSAEFARAFAGVDVPWKQSWAQVCVRAGDVLSE